MKNIFDYEKNILSFTTKDGFVIDLRLRGKVTIITGASSTGKSWIIRCIKGYKDVDPSCTPYNCDNVVIIDGINDYRTLTTVKNCLIIIDRGDVALNPDFVQFINKDRSNHYLIVARGNTGIVTTPNHFAKLKKDGKNFYLEYLFNEEGWC